MTGATDREERLAQLRGKLAARQGKKEYGKNCEAIRKEIAKLEREFDL